MRIHAILGLVVACLLFAARAIAADLDEDEYDREREAQYERNYLLLGLAANRSHVSNVSSETDLWMGRLEGGYVIPLTEGAGPLWAMRFGVGGGPVEDGFLFTLPISFAYGFRTPAILGYAGGTFGIGGGRGKASGDIGPLFGAVAALGFAADRVQLLAEARIEYVFLKAGQSFALWGYGPVIAFVL